MDQICNKFMRKFQFHAACRGLFLRLALDMPFFRRFSANLVKMEKFCAAILLRLH